MPLVAPNRSLPLASPARALRRLPIGPSAAESGLPRTEASPRPRGLPKLAIALVVGLMLPTELSAQLGPLRISAYRAVLIAAFFPCLVRLVSGRAGRWLASDVLVAAFAAWGVASLAVNDGVGEALESGGILVVETLGAYLVGRIALRSREDYLAMARALFAGLCVVLAVNLPEMLTGTRLVHQAFGALPGGAPGIVVEPRFGLARAFGPFDHPILNGVFCSTALSICWDLRPASREGFGRRALRGAVVGLAALTSLSSGAILALAMQGGLLAYRRLMRAVRARWMLLAGAASLLYAALSAISERSGLKALMWYLTFDRATASYRLLIWEHGGTNVGNHPWFGIGHGDWERPEWMSPSVDSFWLLTTMTYGLPAITFLAAAILASLRRAGSVRDPDPDGVRLRQSWIIAWVALAFAGFTVHYWNNVFVLIGFLLGAGAWMGTPVPAEVRVTAGNGASRLPAGRTGVLTATRAPRPARGMTRRKDGPR